MELDDYLLARGITLILAEMKDPVRDQLAEYGLTINGKPRFDDSRFAPTTGAKVDEITGQLRTDIGPTDPSPAP